MTDTANPPTAAMGGRRAITWRRRWAAAGQVWRTFARSRSGLVGLGILVLIVVLALLAPVLSDAAQLDVTQATGARMAAPSGQDWLGTDESGRSVLVLLWWGSRISLLVGFAAAALCVGIGTVVGLLAAHFGRWVAAILLRVTDFFLVLPSLVLAVALSAALHAGTGTVILAIGLTSWPVTARLVRAQTLTVETRPYIERARALGGGHWHVVLRHVLPAVLPLVLANTTLNVANAIIAESTLAFLGVGDLSSTSWGEMLHAAWTNGAVTAGAWWYLLPPGLAIVVVVLAFTLCGRALEAVLTPALRGGGRR
jgi:peptide/nickel transport system permease protein